MVGWYYQLNRHEFEWALGVDDGQGSLVCCSPWGCKEADITERLSNNNHLSIYLSVYLSINSVYLFISLSIYQLYHLCTQRESQKESPDSTSILSFKNKRSLLKKTHFLK